jgi:Raf kinase inhibitor-like YbhB/YbcL family protein
MPGDAGVGSRTAARSGRRRAACLVAAVAVLVTPMAACGDDGRALREPGADQTTTSAPVVTTTSTVAAGGGSTATTVPMQLTSPTFTDGSTIPPAYTCRGADISPPLSWVGIPAGTVELALVVRDIDADMFAHWVVAGLSPAVGGLAEDSPPPGVEATNDFGRGGWAGPCPPSGTHNYQFVVYALAQPSGLTPGLPGEQAAQAIETASVRMSAALSGTAVAA